MASLNHLETDALLEMRISQEAYSEDYYSSHCGPIPYDRAQPEWASFFGGVADKIVKLLRPRRVFDAGCAHGFLVEALWDRGVQAWGRDISSFAISQARSDIKSFVSQGSISEPIEGLYDLVICIEVLEHMSEAEALQSIAAMTDSAPQILFSSSPTDLDEPTHVNVKPLRWWLDRFADVGFSPAANIDASFLTPHAFVIERSETGHSVKALDAFASLIRERMNSQSEAATINKLRAEAAQSFSSLAESSAVIDSLRAENGRLLTDIRMISELAHSAKLDSSVARADNLRLMAQNSKMITDVQIVEDGAKLRSVILSTAQNSILICEQQIQQIVRERDAILYSTMWRILRPLRTIVGAVPQPLRRTLRRGIRAIYWTASFQLTRRVQEWRIAQQQLNSGQKEPAGSDSPVCLLPPSDLVAPDTLSVGQTLGIASDPDVYADWIQRCDTLSKEDCQLILDHIERLPQHPLISIVMAAHETPSKILEEAINSVRAQLYPNWELCIADDASTSLAVRLILKKAAAADTRIRWVRRDTNGNISVASNTALSIATGVFVALMDHDDRLSRTALYEIAVGLNEHPKADIFFSDEDRFDEVKGRHSPYFKPAWDPDLILGQNSVSHLGVYRRTLIEQIGGFREGFEGSQDHDLTLRASVASSADRIHHIPAVLYHWRVRANESFSDTQLNRCVDASRRAVTEHIRQLPGGEGAAVIAHPIIPNYHRVCWPLPAQPPLVSIIVPTRDKADLLARCVTGILCRTDYPDIELMIVDNGSTDESACSLLRSLENDQRVRIIRDDGPFNYSKLNNRAAKEAKGEILVLVNNDIDVLDGGWLRELVSHALRPDVGSVGARLLYGNGTIQHAGVVLGVGSFLDGPGIAGHFGNDEIAGGVGYFAHSALTRTVQANTAACLAVRRNLYLDVGGLDEVNLPVAFNDVDFCLRVQERGFRNVWTPFAELLHLESASRGKDITEKQRIRACRESLFMRERWGDVLDNDPYYNANLSRSDHMYRLPSHARRSPPWRQEASGVAS